MAVRELAIRNFSGGLNTRDAPSELSENEFVDSMNVTLDERGGVWKRLGSVRRWSPFGASAKPQNIFDWATRGFVVTQIGAGMHVNNNAAFLTWSTTDRCGMCEFNGNLMLIHPVDGFRIYDGTTVSGPFTNSPKGNCLATWQNKVWAGGNPDNPARLTWCDAGTPNTWNVNGWVELRDKDSAKITCLAGSGGMDIQGRPGLLVFKEESAYRVYDASTGAYTTLDYNIGAGGALAFAQVYGRTYTVTAKGIFYTDGTSPMVEVSGLIENFFHSTYINTARQDLYAMGKYLDRIYVSLPRSGSTINDVALEHSPLGKWTVPHSNAATCYTRARGETQMAMGSPLVDGVILNSHQGGQDDGVNISSQFQTRWIEPNAGNKARIRRLRFIGRGNFTAYPMVDYMEATGFAGIPVTIQPAEFLYDDGNLYDDPDVVYSGLGLQAYEDAWSIGVAKALSVRIEETSGGTQSGLPIMDSNIGSVMGAWNLSQVNIFAIDLGMV